MHQLIPHLARLKKARGYEGCAGEAGRGTLALAQVTYPSAPLSLHLALLVIKVSDWAGYILSERSEQDISEESGRDSCCQMQEAPL